jgi:hypothetical protein
MAGVEEDSIIKSFVTCMLCQILFKRSNQGGYDGQGMQHA